MADGKRDTRKPQRDEPDILPRQVQLLVSRFLGFYQRPVYKLMNDA